MADNQGPGFETLMCITIKRKEEVKPINFKKLFGGRRGLQFRNSLVQRNKVQWITPGGIINFKAVK